ncbi:MAG TPA: aldolase/citrate lyase family protein [Roseiarcus sp.]|jgi:citrate lyase beta subunit|nr:aldolase/citrate lyase family protein [Roseiarcus sp.]
MRSLLIALADERRLAEALLSGAEAVVVDLAGSKPAERAAARAIAARFLERAAEKWKPVFREKARKIRESGASGESTESPDAPEGTRRRGAGPRLIVRVNPLDSGETDADLDAAMAHAPDAILLPSSLGAASVHELSAKLALREADFALADGATRIIAVVGTAQALFGMGSYRGSSARLAGIGWSAESLRADIGAETDRDPSGAYASPWRLARDLTLLAAASAGVAAIDTAFASVRDTDGLRAEALAARRDGFAGKVAIDPVQAGVINDVFTFRSTPPRERSPP